VVADEVRKLAERTSKATEEIGAMIGNIQSETARSVASMKSGKEEVEGGLTLAEEAVAALDQIVASSNDSAQMIETIATAAEEQSVTTDHVTENMESIARVTGDTEAFSRELEDSAKQLTERARELSEVMDWFRLEGSEGKAKG
jgi:methyl-accepting chemotaxis protein